ncbi:hypothetical protein HN681_02690 [archaeon]|jgi:hypothetical protein|nr:hypothetical protein [archaeon]MBT3731175.1 hypothetical protein [archaeon]MBT4670071.1 hypothetical protein [archaeon]MBT5030629.1 hypothetical protein [archaeon]MBT5287981.1 hypothetical protein [archaeon]
MELDKLLSQNGLVQEYPRAQDIRERASLSSPIKLFYGETYDDKGHTIDSMKYYLFVADLADSLREEGFFVDPTILVADTAACRNIKPTLKDRYMSLGNERADFIRKVNDIYGTGLKILKMSDYIDSDKFLSEREKIIGLCKSEPELMEDIERSVPQSKIDIERKKGFLYSFDEITTILDLDIKIGPPRENLYDVLARKIATKYGKRGLMSLFLTPTFPVGVDWTYFFINEGIEDHGITAYKAGSKRLQHFRVLVGKSDPSIIRGHIDNSFISTNSDLPNPVLDIGIICEMAKRRIEKSNSPSSLADEFYRGEITPSQLKEKVKGDIDKFILSKF